MIVVEKAGPLTTLQDLGRPGYAHLGVSRSGAADRFSLVRANRLVGNPDGAAALEMTMVGARLRFGRAARVAIAGAPMPVSLDGSVAPHDAAFEVNAGQLLQIGAAPRGVRSYLAVAGGFDAPPVLGSRSTDVLSGLGPPPLRDGDVLKSMGSGSIDFPGQESMGSESIAGSLVSESGSESIDSPAGNRSTPTPLILGPENRSNLTPTILDSTVLRFLPGPRDDWFAPIALAGFATADYSVSPNSNRVAVRLDGPALIRAVAGELASEGLVPGAIQVPADGRPLVFLADHPVTGGYPVLGVVVPEDLPRLAQARPGSRVLFRRAQSG